MTASTLRCLAALLGACLAGGAPAAQTQGAPAGDGGRAIQMVRAAGMPLNDPQLPPGSLTVRLVRGAFTEDLSGLTVTAAIDGQAPRQGVTGEKGRATFAHLPLGARVTVSAVVAGEHLTSDPFTMPEGTGVRVLLVTSQDGASVEHAALQAPAPASSPVSEVAPQQEPSGFATSDAALPVGLAVVTLAVAVAVLWRRRRHSVP